MDLRELEAYRLEDAVKFHNELNPRLWQAEKLRPEVREALLRIADDFRQSLGLRELNVKDITISGSNAAYTYTPHSDIDLHLVVDMPRDDEIYRELFDAKKYQYNDENDFKIGGADVELYVQDAAKPHASQGIYSVRDDRWVRVPSRRQPTIDDSAVENKYMDLARRIDQAIDRGDADRMHRLWTKIKDMRKAGLAKTGEFGVENLVFKVLRNNGTIERLMKAQQEIKNREMSLAERRRGRRRKSRNRWGYFGGMWYPGYSYGVGSSEASSSDGGGGDGGDGESVNEATVTSIKARRYPLVVYGHPFDWNVYDLRNNKMVANVLGGDRSESKLYEIRIKSSGMTPKTRMPPTYVLTAGAHDNPPYKAYELVAPEGGFGKIEKSPGPGGTTKLRPDQDDVLRHFFKVLGGGRYWGYDLNLVEEGLDQWDLIEKALGAEIMDVDDAMELGYTDVDPEDSSGIVLTPSATAAGVTESTESVSDLEQVLHGFIKACAEYLHMTEMPRVVLIRDPAWTRENGTFGRFNTETNTLELAINHRHPLDIIRTMAHEMTHARQNEVTDLPADAGRTGSPYEDEANAMAGRFMRHVAEHHPELFHELPMDEDYDPNGPPPGPEFKPTMPMGTIRVDVSDVYDWYKLGQHISNMKGLGKHDFGKGPPSTILSFGDEDLEHQYIQALQKTGLDVTDIDPKSPGPKQGIKTDPTYNVNEILDKESAAKMYWSKDNYMMGGRGGDGFILHTAAARDKNKNILKYNFYDFPKYNSTAVEFSRAVGPWGDNFGIDNAGDQYTVFATLIQAFTEYLRKHDPKYIVFGAKEPSRAKLYQAFINRFASRFGYRQADPAIIPRPVRDAILTSADTPFLLQKTRSAKKPVNEQAGGGIPAWRIRFQRFRGKPSFMPEREGKVYLMPMDNSALRTFGNLTGKDDVKIRNMPTEAYLVSGDAMVGDMSIINAISQESRGNNDPKRIDDLKRLYLNYRVPYSQYRPGMFKYPEILATPDQLLQKLDQSVSYDKNSGEIVFKDRTREDVYEASGYIPVNDEEARDPRYSMAITQDIRPGETQRQAAKMGWKTDAAGRPPLLMPRVPDKKSSTAKNTPDHKLVLAEQLRREFQSYSNDVVESTEQPQALLEVDMSPGALRSWANSEEAKNITAGFEAEMIFRYAQRASDSDDWSDDDAPYPDYEDDPRARSIDDVIEFFSLYNDYTSNSQRDLDRARERLFEEYIEWVDAQLQDRWDSEKDEVIRDYMESNVWAAEKKRRIESALEDITDKDPEQVMGSESEEDRALVQGAVDQARAEFEAEVQEEIDNPLGYAHDEAFQAWRDVERDNYEESNWFKDNYPRMTDVRDAVDLEWPIWVTPEPEARAGRTPDEIGAELDSVVPVGSVVVSTGYHSTKRTADRWIMEPDSSIDPDDREDAGWEIVSPPMPLNTALTALRDVMEWARGNGDAYTNRSTGLHMGVSVPSQETVDYVKLILFMGDKHVLDQFGRLSNTYCNSAMDRIQTNVKNTVDRLKLDPGTERGAGGIIDIPWAMELMRQGMLEIAGKTVKQNVGVDKYTSAHIKLGYIEFRSPGGNYLDQNIDELTNTMLRFARALSIASDPNAYRQEYAKKLYRLISPQGNDALQLFAAFSTGLLDKKELKQEWNKIQALRVIQKPRAGADILWSVTNDWTRQTMTVRAATETQALTRALEFSDENNLGWRRIELRATPQRVVPTTTGPQAPDLPAEPTNTAQALDNRADSQQVQRTVQAPQARSDRETRELPQWLVNSHAERTQAPPTRVLVRAADAQAALAQAREILGPRFDNVPNEHFTIAPVVRAQGDQGQGD